MSRINRSLSITFTPNRFSKLNNFFEVRCSSTITYFTLGDSFRRSLISWAFPEPTPYSAWLRYFCVKTFTTCQSVIDSAKLFASCSVKLYGYVTRTTSIDLKRIQFPTHKFPRLKEEYIISQF